MNNLTSDLECHAEVFHFSIYKPQPGSAQYVINQGMEGIRLICDVEIHFGDKMFTKVKYTFKEPVGKYHDREGWDVLALIHEKIREIEAKFIREKGIKPLMIEKGETK